MSLAYNDISIFDYLYILSISFSNSGVRCEKQMYRASIELFLREKQH